MALDDLELSLMAFPQNWDWKKQQLNVNLLLLPLGNPLVPLGGGPQFAGTTIFVKAQFIAGLDNLPLTTSPVALTLPFTVAPPPGASALFQNVLNSLPAGTNVTNVKVDKTKVPDNKVRIKKALPPSYTNAFPFERARNDDLLVGDGYGCAVQAQSPGGLNPPQEGPPKLIAWGQIVSFLLRQPALAQAVGLWYPITIPVAAATVNDGGWLFFSLDDSSLANPYVNDWKGNPDTVKSYVARIPQLDSATDRRIFAAALFPLLAATDSKLAEAQLEAEVYDDGFAQIVHCNQPETVDAATGETDSIPPGTEAGIQIGWDDEQVTVWLNRQIDLLRDRVNASNIAPESPLGVQGYRIDVQLKGDANWHSLCLVSGGLPFSGSTSDGSGFTPSGELFVAPAPVRPTTANWTDPNPEPAWLPRYFSQWRGTSLVAQDDVVSKITPPNPNKKTMPSSTLPGDLTGVPTLRYGNDYQFRVRLTDLTGGGPNSLEGPLHPGLAPSGFCPFRRFLPPKTLEVASTPPPPPPPAIPDAVRTITTLDVRKPRIGYPEAIFAGVPPSTFTGANLDTLIADAQAAGRALSVADPDVDRFQVLVEARVPAHDSSGVSGTLPDELDGDRYRVVYSIIEHFPSGADPDPVVTLTLDYSDQDDIATIVAPADDSPDLVIPTARDVRVRLVPLCTDRSNYYGTPTPPVGLSTDFIVRKEAASEEDLYNFDPPTQLKAFYFQPATNMPQLMAQALGLNSDNLTLSAVPGNRTVFAAAGGLRHTLAPDASSITFANLTEFLDHWIVAFVIDIARDWTWDGFAEPAMTIFRDAPGNAIGTVTYYRTVSSNAVGGLQHSPDRSSARIIFFDTLNPLAAPDKFPAPLNPIYTVVASFKSAPDRQNTYNTLVLPITERPHQTPKIVSTGIAESEYKAAPDYSETYVRDRYLWIEFEQPIADKDDDAYFGRVLSYGPDPLLAAILLPPETLPEAVEPPIPLDPEPMREIFAGQSCDGAGLDAMQQLIPAVSSSGHADKVHFLLPLPPGISPEALELFGFWTYEFRVGHLNKCCTAQGRFGRRLRVTGIQHPVPHMICTAQRNEIAVVATAPYATTVLNGVRVYDLQFGDPQTTLWFMLYTQVLQVDGTAHRNILLAHKQGRLLPDWAGNPYLAGKTGIVQEEYLSYKLLTVHTANREPRGFALFSQPLISQALTELGLPLNSPLSVLAVEVLPGPLHIRNLDRNLGLVGEVNPNLLSTSDSGGASTQQEDPLGTQLGRRRILRTSLLTQVPPIC